MNIEYLVDHSSSFLKYLTVTSLGLFRVLQTLVTPGMLSTRLIGFHGGSTVLHSNPMQKIFTLPYGSQIFYFAPILMLFVFLLFTILRKNLKPIFKQICSSKNFF